MLSTSNSILFSCSFKMAETEARHPCMHSVTVCSVDWSQQQLPPLSQDHASQ